LPRYFDAIDLPVPVETAFDCVADFGRTSEWDPGVVQAERLTEGEVRRGSRFRVLVSFLGRRIPLEYSITEFERPTRIVLNGGDSSLRSVDEITFTSRPGGSRVTYEARLAHVNIRRVADPMLELLLQRIGSMAMRGLRERLAGHSFGRTESGVAVGIAHQSDS
jgi:carbon monoxide dehydrogenase subunit G